MFVDAVESLGTTIFRPNHLAGTILKSRQATQRVILFITWVAFLLRANTLGGQSLWRDEVDAIRFSSWPLSQLLAGLFQMGHNGPLFFLLLRPWRVLTGDSELALRFPAVVLGSLAIPLAYILSRQLGLKRRVGLGLSLLLATSPYLVWYGQEAKMYALLLSLILLAFLAYLKALRQPQARWWLVFVGATTLSFYTHILAPLMLPVFGLTALLHRNSLSQAWRAWSLSMLCLTVPYLPLAWWQLPLLLAGFQSGHIFYSLREQVFLLLQLYSSGLSRFIGLTAVIIFVFLFLSGLLLGTTHRSRGAVWPKPRQRLTLASWVLVPPLIVYLISLRVQVFEDRYLIYITPAFYLLVAIGLSVVRHYQRWLAALCLGLILTINLMGIWQQQRQPLKADFRAVAGYLAGQPRPPQTIMIQAPYLQHTLAYYYGTDYQLLEGLWTNGGKTEVEVNHEMRVLTAGLKEVWLIVSEEDLWDNRHLIRAWLDQEASLVSQAKFVRVAVYHYRFP
jgi:uncharacterized membrane protein